MNIEIKATFVLQGGAKQIMYLEKKQKQYVADIAHDLHAVSFVVENL